MSEPKKYTAKEAMHWMLDNPLDEMITDRQIVFHYDQGKFYSSYLDDAGEIEAWDEDYVTDNMCCTLYVRSQYDAWQAELKEESRKNELMRNRTSEEFADFTAEPYRQNIHTDETKEYEKKLEPQEGESLRHFIYRSLTACFPPYRGRTDSQQAWIEAYVKREIEKALGK